MASIIIPSEKIEKAASIFKAAAHPLRMKIIKLINDKGEVNVNVIYNTLKIEQSITSQHLRNLRLADLVLTRREGKKIFYSVNRQAFERINKAVESMELSSKPAKKSK
jgi:ArsR family transcriptional regulator